MKNRPGEYIMDKTTAEYIVKKYFSRKTGGRTEEDLTPVCRALEALGQRRTVQNGPAREFPAAGHSIQNPLDDAVRSRIRGSRPYVVRDISEDETEITMYGEVVETVPTDWWTGEKIDGLFICLADFLNELEGLKDKAAVTIHINSPGGDADAGRAIYNRLSEMENVTTICDSMAASAASIIFMAGQTRKMYAGSQLMIHNASTFVLGSYQSRDLEELKAMLDSYDSALAEIYASKVNKTKQQIAHMMDKTTWLSAADAVEQGFATEIIENSQAVMNLIGGGKYLVCNGIPMRTAGMELPAGIKEIADMAEAMRAINATTAAVQQAAANPVPDEPEEETECKGGKAMTLDELRKEHPELCEQILAEAKTADAAAEEQAVKDAVAAERQRIKDIESIEDSIADRELIRDAKYGEHPMDAKDLAFAAMQKQAAIGAKVLHDMQEDTKNSGVMDIGAEPARDLEGIKDTAEMTDAELDACIASALQKGGKKA